MGQLLLGVFHPGVVLIILGGVLLGGQQGRQGHGNDFHVRVVEVLHLHLGLALFHPVDVGGEDVPQLPQPLPVIGGSQLLLLDGHFPGHPLGKILQGFPQALGFLTHGVLLLPQHIGHVQQLTEGLRLLTRPILIDGTEGKLLGVPLGIRGVPGLGICEIPGEKGRKGLGKGRLVRPFQPGLRIPGGVQRRLPAH